MSGDRPEDGWHASILCFRTVDDDVAPKRVHRTGRMLDPPQDQKH